MRILAKLAARMEEITVGVGLEKKDGGRHRGRRFGGFVLHRLVTYSGIGGDDPSPVVLFELFSEAPFVNSYIIFSSAL